MSGGTWNYQDVSVDNYHARDIYEIINALIDVFHLIDWAESGDTDIEYAAPLVYKRMLELGNFLFGGDSI